MKQTGIRVGHIEIKKKDGKIMVVRKRRFLNASQAIAAKKSPKQRYGKR